MSIEHEIKLARVKCLKEGRTADSAFIALLQSSASTIAKIEDRSVADEDFIKAFNAELKALDKTENLITKDGTQVVGNTLMDPINSKRNIINALMPKQLTDDELTEIIQSLIDDHANIGQIFQHLNANYLGKFSSVKAQELAKSLK